VEQGKLAEIEGVGWCDCFDLNGSSRRHGEHGWQQNILLSSSKVALKLPRTLSHMQDATPTPANRTWEIKGLDGELRAPTDLKTFSTRALTHGSSGRVSDPEPHGQSEVPRMVHSDERRRGRVTETGSWGSQRETTENCHKECWGQNSRSLSK
jgi:hypothetical protein